MSHHPAQSSAGAIFALGLYGGLVKKSVPSLIGSTVLAASFLATRQLILSANDNKQYVNAYLLGAGSGLLALTLGSMRFKKSSVKLPPVPIFLISVGAANFLFYSYKVKQWSE